MPERAIPSHAGAVEALASLEAVLEPEVFWSPEGIGQCPQEAQDAYLDHLCRDLQWCGLKDFETARLIFREHPEDAWMRRVLLREAPLRYQTTRNPLGWGKWPLALGWYAGLSPEVWGMPLLTSNRGMNYPAVLDLAWDATWVPSHLRVPGELRLSGCKKLRYLGEGLSATSIRLANSSLKALPKGVWVTWDLDLDRTSISVLPEDLRVGGVLSIAGTPLAEFGDAEIRAMAPGVTGEIRR